MAPLSSVGFCAAALQRPSIPVKNTFIHFEPFSTTLPSARSRSSTCPPRSSGESAWQDAARELCHAMSLFRPTSAKCLETVKDVVVDPEVETASTPVSPCASSSNLAPSAVAAPIKCSGGTTEPDAISEASTRETESTTTESHTEGSTSPAWTCVASRKKAATPSSTVSVQAACYSKRSGKSNYTQKESWRSNRSEGRSEGGLPNFQRIDVGIEDDQKFRVVQRLIGPRGKHMRDIVTMSGGAKLWITGRGSRSWEDDEGPLRLSVGATSRSVFDNALRLVEELLTKVREEHSKMYPVRSSKSQQWA
mmetsp:Transcript_43223/g.113727  ORF Transcript_43223/g.113727 Transcript_43223/m.113727 type:complete len:307 (-) Transcript_43223:368-1288(-)